MKSILDVINKKRSFCLFVSLPEMVFSLFLFSCLSYIAGSLAQTNTGGQGLQDLKDIKIYSFQSILFFSQCISSFVLSTKNINIVMEACCKVEVFQLPDYFMTN